MRNVKFIFVALLFTQGARADYKPATWRELTCTFHQPSSVVVRSPNEYYVADTSAEQKNIVYKVKKGIPSPILETNYRLEKLEVDTRRGYLFLAHEGKVSIHKISKAEIEYKVFSLESVEHIDDMSFSIMNRKLYVLTGGGAKVWSIDHVKDKVSLVLDRSKKDGESPTLWNHILASTDGKRLYWTGKGDQGGPGQLGVFSLESQKTETKVSLKSTAPSGLAVYKNFFVIPNSDNGTIESFQMKNWKPANAKVPEGTPHTAAFATDALDLIALQTVEGKPCLRALPLHIKE